MLPRYTKLIGLIEAAPFDASPAEAAKFNRLYGASASSEAQRRKINLRLAELHLEMASAP